MNAAIKHGTPSLTSLPTDGGVSCFGRSAVLVVHLEVAYPVSDRTRLCLASVELMELAGPLGHLPRVTVCVTKTFKIIISMFLYKK